MNFMVVSPAPGAPSPSAPRDADARALPAGLADELSALLGGTPSVDAPHRARWRAPGADDATRERATALAVEAGCDAAWLPPLSLSDFSVLAMDMDSTLIGIECVDEIADFAGLKAEVAAITEAAMRGEIGDYQESLRRRVALLEGLPETALQRVLDERLRLNPGAESLVGAAHAAGLRTLLVSGGFTFFTDRMQARLGLTRTRSNVLEIVDGRLTGRLLGEIVDAGAKAETLAAFCRELNVPVSRAIAVGDGANDLKMMGISGLSVAYHAKPVVAAQCRVAIRHGGLDTLLDWLAD